MKEIIISLATIIGIIAIITVILGYPIMLLWNWLMPVIFGLSKITFWQALGLNFLSNILFKSSSYKNN